MRTFVAIEIDEQCRRKISRALAVLQGAAHGVKWVDPAIMHLTVKFIGELREQELPAAVEAIKAAAAASKPFVMKISGISGFPPRGKPRVIHSPIEEPTGTLSALAEAIDRALADAIGTERETRAFAAHVTLGRVKDGRDCPPIEDLAKLVPGADFGEVSVDAVVLMKSELRPAGPIYTAFERVALGH